MIGIPQKKGGLAREYFIAFTTPHRKVPSIVVTSHTDQFFFVVTNAAMDGFEVRPILEAPISPRKQASER